MKTVISLLACAFSLDAQIEIKRNVLPNGRQEIRLRNDSPVSLVAYAVSTKQASSVYGDVFLDTVIDPEATTLPPSQERIVNRPFRSRPGQPAEPAEAPIVSAGIFADGSTAGDPLLLALLMLRRSNTLLAVEMALETLADAERQSTSLYQLIVQFKKMVDSLQRWYLRPEQKIGLLVYEPVLGKLMHMPKRKDGSPDPLAKFLAEETATLRQQRVKLSESQPSLANAGYMLH